MTVYQGAHYLPATLESVLTQSFTDFEFIIVDDGSSDDTGALLDTARLATGAWPCCAIHQPGHYRSMNRLFRWRAAAL